MSENIIPEPEVGMGATECVGSDRYAYTIVEVIRTKAGKAKAIRVRACKSTVVSGSGHDGSAKYVHEEDESAPTILVKRVASGRNKGRWGQPYGWFGIGYRDAYRDPSF